MIRRLFNAITSIYAHMRPEALLISSFGTAITVGTLLLWLPICHRGSVGLLEAFFTATSAVCVTGLIVVDTGTVFSPLGQIIILALIQLGGIGVMTFAALTFQLLGKRLSIAGQAAMTESLVHDELKRGFRLYFTRILYLLGSIELIGAAVLFIGMLSEHSVLFAAYSAIFHSISAFCNAGFSLYSDSLIGFNHNPLIITTITALIIVGGIGHPVIFDFIRVAQSRKNNGKSFWSVLTIHTRIVLVMTLVLLSAGAILLLLTSLPEIGFNLSASIFQSVTARTAGFNTVEIGLLPQSTLLVLVMLMFIGGSPGSCAGGVKTTTFALWITQLSGRLKGRLDVVIQDRHMPQPLVRRSLTIISLAFLLNAIGIFILSMTESGASLRDILFEQVSAFGTVGLSTGLTSRLSALGRLWIIATMFIGRIGPLTAVILLLSKRPIDVRYPEGKVMIG
ncbi:MAG: ATPase [Chitinivibrionales bacterium]|nr:ATPase [Chitinivibrionales bacterium]